MDETKACFALIAWNFLEKPGVRDHHPWVMAGHPLAGYDQSNHEQLEDMMDKLVELWLNPINLGVLFLCVTAGIWILAHSGPSHKDP